MTLDIALPTTAPQAPGRAAVDELVGALHEAARLVAPQWPLTSFVAVNPLGGLEGLGFDEATALAARWTGGASRLRLAELRDAVAAGRVTAVDVDAGIRIHRPDLADAPPVQVGARPVDVVELVRRDLLTGPDPEGGLAAGRCVGERWDRRWGTDLADRVDAAVTAWAVRACDAHGPAGGTWRSWREQDLEARAVRSLTDGVDRRWLAGLPDDPVDVLAEALHAASVRPEHRVDELRGQLCRLRGWAGYARWCEAWAPPDHDGPRLGLVDLVAVRLALEVAAVRAASRDRGVPAPPPSAPPVLDELVDERAFAVAGDLGTHDAVSIARIAEALVTVRLVERPGLALAGLERALAARLLDGIDGTGPATVLGPVYADTVPVRHRRATPHLADPAADALARVVCCIDVRSEPLRRHLEALGPYETSGFAGFFGVAARVREAGWPRPEPRCPVLVDPGLAARPVPAPGAAGPERILAARTRAGAGRAGLDAAHHGGASPFVLAEVAGWWSGVRAVGRVLRPRPRRPAAPDGALALEVPGADGAEATERLVATAAGIVRALGLHRGTPPLVVLCGHTSQSRGNAHATALECGACGGAPGATSARLAASLLDDPEVRRGLAAEGLALSEDTWFVPAVHDTVTDRVTLLDRDAVPPGHRELLAALDADLARAGAAVAEERLAGLPGSRRAGDRGGDPAQVRPEWGLAGCAAVVVGPRSLTRSLDLGGRAFLHCYDTEADPDGRTLEAVLTAPLVVAHWISSQYLFSSLDPEVFGAGDKLLHNPVGGVGVVTGTGGDLRVGLPRQSVALDGRRVHEPLRLLAVVDAPLDRVDAVVARAEAVRTLVEGSWVRLVARGPDGSWRWRSPSGGWRDDEGMAA